LQHKSVHFYTYLLTCLLNIDIDIDIAIFSQYRIDIATTSNKWYRNITTML